MLVLCDLHFAPWQYGLALAVPWIGGSAGSRVAGPTAAKYGERQVCGSRPRTSTPARTVAQEMWPPVIRRRVSLP
ncbi:hypothetical protein GCM10023214_25230 [Amycolatopsis dongchuanensis]|uniref:Uncharacterized protein n=1 Tax=Amycolatopsis dongchuanensis TaxID=1070866 RepID=A0ABP9QF36_9PSEU